MTNSRDLRPGSESRLFLAFAVQPFATALLAFVLFPIVEYTGRPLYGGQPASFLDGAVAFAMGVGVTALFVTVLAALPLFVWLQKRGPVTSEQVFASGAILGNLPSALIMASLVLSGSSRGASTDLDSVVYGPAGL